MNIDLPIFSILGCRDTYPRNYPRSCPRCSKLKSKCNKTWKSALSGNRLKNCRNKIKGSQLNQKVGQLCKKSCKTCGK